MASSGQYGAVGRAGPLTFRQLEYEEDLLVMKPMNYQTIIYISGISRVWEKIFFQNITLHSWLAYYWHRMFNLTQLSENISHKKLNWEYKICQKKTFS